MKELKKWILLMDGIKAKVIARDSENNYRFIYGTQRIEGFDHQEKVHIHHLAKIKQHGGSKESHHIFPLDDKPKKIDKEIFTKKIANFLNHNQNLFDKVILVAPSQILGTLRILLHKEIKRKVCQEIQKDLMKVSLNELDAYF